MNYQLQFDPYTGTVNSVTVVGKNIFIPFNPENADYQAYLAWVADGNTPLPPDPPAEGAN
jgi:hypothetical protein